MPTKALNEGVADHQSAASDIGALLAELSTREIEERAMEPDPGMQLENRIAMARRFETDFDTEELGAPSGYTCPDCNGSLITLSEHSFRCQVGHAWSADALLAAQDREVEGALWIAVRSLQEKAKLSRQLAGKVGPGMMYDRYTSMAEETERALEVLTDRLGNGDDAVREASG
jgi:two-component system chemotaxis response regulator CheB